MRRASNWRNYQRDLRRQRRFGLLWRQAAVLAPLALLLGLTFLGVWQVACRISGGSGGPIPSVQAETEGRLSKAELAILLGNRLLDAERPGLLSVGAGEQTLSVQTTIDPELQRYLSGVLADSGALRGACVVLEADTGRVLALASYDPQGGANLCLEPVPAASLFKLVTAAAAVQERGFGAESRLYYCGDPHGMPGRYTLSRPRRGTGVTLAGAFARSINPVFGQLGALDVGADRLRRWGERCGFNRPIPFELALPASHLEVPADQIEVARVASGYNRVTTISPVHAALLAAAVANDGRLVEPTLVSQVVDADSKTLYSPHPATLEPFSPRCAQELKRMMAATVSEGTCRRSLAPYLGRGRLADLEVGGKTGSISGEDGGIKYDWFAGYALEQGGERRLAVAVLLQHGRYLGHKAPTVAACAIRRYFGLEDLTLWRPQPPKAKASHHKARTHRAHARSRRSA